MAILVANWVNIHWSKSMINLEREFDKKKLTVYLNAIKTRLNPLFRLHGAHEANFLILSCIPAQ